MRTTTRTGANHPLHLICTLFTCGLWSPVWIVCAIVGRKTTVTVPERPVWPSDLRYVCEGCRHYGMPNHLPGHCPYSVPLQRVAGRVDGPPCGGCGEPLWNGKSHGGCVRG